ncbi:DUF503 domain-containing protein [Desulfocurvus sp.]|jgi:hypothetical protein|uniref:DUF503 domain-containing protein n=1 Tax=Desulfocurvus sp. TaxID=2871698 RepID=UPI0025C23175|nr:DUF503 domain-containing protein [Desulfocurvus sp.]MCK9239167.1 DUF503 domain-containing protein [Desulfocurvus sp.]
MIIGVLTLTFRLHGNRSLKGKRQVAASLKQKLRNSFNVAVSEIARQDDLGTLALAVVTVGPDSRVVQSRLDKALMHAQAATSEELADSGIELFSADGADADPGAPQDWN